MVFGLRAQAFVTQADVAVLTGVPIKEPKVVGIYNTLGNRVRGQAARQASAQPTVALRVQGECTRRTGDSRVWMHCPLCGRVALALELANNGFMEFLETAPK